METKRCYSVQEVQKILGVGRAAVLELMRVNAFRWVTVGGKYRISRRSFDSWLDDALGETEEEAVPDAVGMGVASAGGDAAGMGVTPVGADVAAAQPAVWVI